MLDDVRQDFGDFENLLDQRFRIVPSQGFATSSAKMRFDLDDLIGFESNAFVTSMA